MQHSKQCLMGYVLSFHLLQPFTPPAEQSHIKLTEWRQNIFCTSSTTPTKTPRVRNTGEEREKIHGERKHTREINVLMTTRWVGGSSLAQKLTLSWTNSQARNRLFQGQREYIGTRCRHGQRNGEGSWRLQYGDRATTGRARVPNDWLVLLLACMHARCC
jgi:hypothetical protein